MEGSMEKTNKMLAFLHPIIEEADPELEDFLIRYVLNHFHVFGISVSFLSLFVVIELWLNVLSCRTEACTIHVHMIVIPWSDFDWLWFENLI